MSSRKSLVDTIGTMTETLEIMLYFSLLETGKQRLWNC